MAYIGDSSLSPEIQDRVGSTFSHTLELADAGKQTEALLGCDFILRLDPLFEPARTLQERIKGSGSSPIETRDLRSMTAEPEPEPEPPVDGTGKRVDRGVVGVWNPVETAEAGRARVDSEDEPVMYDPTEDHLEWASESELEKRRSAAHREIADLAEADKGDRIEGLLAEGQRALARERYQTAIDAWSRIFLIDVGNEEAGRRIELAQRLKAEREREIEQLYNEGDAHLEAGDSGLAMAAFKRVLKLQPDHLAARDKLEQIDSRGTGASAAEPKDNLEESAATTAADADVLIGDLEEGWESDDGSSGPELLALGTMVPPDDARPMSAADRARAALAEEDGEDLEEIEAVDTEAPAGSLMRALGRPQLRFVAIGSAVLLLVVVGAFLLNRNWSNWFPNAEEDLPTTAAAPPLDRIGRITALREKGDAERALEALKKIRPDEGDYQRAQLLLAEWGAAAETIDVAAIDSENEGSRLALIELARQSYTSGEYLPAARYFTRASALAPLEGSEADLYEDAKRQLEPIAHLVDLYAQREYDLALPSLWRFYEENPDNRDVKRLLVNSHYNLAVRSLRQGSAEQAKGLIEEAVRLDPSDAFAQRLLLFSETYADMGPDILYEIFVSNLESRQ